MAWSLLDSLISPGYSAVLAFRCVSHVVKADYEELTNDKCR